MKSMKKSPKQNWESNIRRTPIILGLSAALCMPSAFSYANASDPVAGELVQPVQQGRTPCRSRGCHHGDASDQRSGNVGSGAQPGQRRQGHYLRYHGRPEL